MAYFTRTHGERPHAKFQPPTMTGLAVHKGQTEGQNKGNANIYVDSWYLLILWLKGRKCKEVCKLHLHKDESLERLYSLHSWLGTVLP